MSDYSDDTLFGQIPAQFAPKGTLSEHYAKLTEQKKTAMKELRAIADTWRETISNAYVNKNFLDLEETYFQFLEGYDWSVKGAEKVLKEAVIWRQRYHPQDLDLTECQQFATQGSNGFMYHYGHDKNGKPVIYIKVAADKLPNGKKDKDIKVKYFIWCFEKCIQRMPKDVYQITWIIDLKHASVSVGLVKALAGVFVQMGDHYVERGGNFIVVNAPWYANLLWGALKIFLTAQTIRKYHIHGNMSTEKVAKTLGEWIDENELPTEFGGKAQVKFNWDLLVKNNEEHRAKVQAEYGVCEPGTESEKSDTPSKEEEIPATDDQIPQQPEGSAGELNENGELPN